MKTGAFLLLLAVPILDSGCRRRPPEITPSTLPVPASSISVPSGTNLAFRTAQNIDSTVAQPGQTFAAVVTRDVNDQASRAVLPSGSPATFILLKRDGAPAQDTLELGLASVMLNGDSYLVSNEPATGSEAIPAARLGVFQGGVMGTERLPAAGQDTKEARRITVSGETIWVPAGSLITFRLDRAVRLIGSHP